MVSLPILAINRTTSQIYPLFKASADFRRFGYACQLLPEDCMEINEMLGLHIITKTCKNLRSITNYSNPKREDDRFYLINFPPAGEPEAFICGVIKGSA
jgi:hypothetical protein